MCITFCARLQLLRTKLYVNIFMFISEHSIFPFLVIWKTQKYIFKTVKCGKAIILSNTRTLNSPLNVAKIILEVEMIFTKSQNFTDRYFTDNKDAKMRKVPELCPFNIASFLFVMLRGNEWKIGEIYEPNLWHFKTSTATHYKLEKCQHIWDYPLLFSPQLTWEICQSCKVILLQCCRQQCP